MGDIAYKEVDDAALGRVVHTQGGDAAQRDQAPLHPPRPLAQGHEAAPGVGHMSGGPASELGGLGGPQASGPEGAREGREGLGAGLDHSLGLGHCGPSERRRNDLRGIWR